ncbi:hypothetical protein HZC32_03250 [Candidatus Woesearchaeota archaeon]|nr:hypothetical protein [Candidatus Woesearchaeota archaeon]
MLPILTKLVPYPLLESFENFILSDYERTRKFLSRVNPNLLEELSKKKAVHMFKIAAEETPAYRKYLQKHKINPKKSLSIQDFDHLVPPTDKASYIKKFDFEERCREGHLPKHGNVDESGGTSGKATNWIRNLNEEEALFKAIRFEYNYVFDGEQKDYFVISAWSTGPWATGIKFCELMERLALVKNTATDSNDIIDTLKMFGKKRNYLIGGYPPFIKNLLEDYKDKINWKEYNIDLVTGGEGVPLEWVYYVKKMLRPGAKVISSYGASDIDIGIGFETPFCFFVRELAAENEKLRIELFGKDELPMVFQYNPTLHYIKPSSRHYIRQIKNSEGREEFEITLLDKNAAAPKIKYNLHDEGRVFSYFKLIEALEKHHPLYLKEFSHRGGQIKNLLHLPFLCIFGRSDGTLSFDGANVFPDQIEEGILKNKELARITHRFKMEKKYDSKHNVQFHIYIELKKGFKPSQELKEKYLKSILTGLQEINPDFRESYSKNKTLRPYLSLRLFGHPLFKGDEAKAKNIYFVQSS